MKVADVLQVVAVGLDTMDAATTDPALSAAAKGAAVVIRLIADMTKDRTPEEAIAILEKIRDEGVKPIGGDELDAQTQAIVDAANARR